MNAILVRIGIDHSFGGWNAPVDPTTGRFVYVPIPEATKTAFHPDCRRGYNEIFKPLRRFCGDFNLTYGVDLKLPATICDASMHLDPDFEHLTYGDDGARRGARIKALARGDLLVFYAGLRPAAECEHKLIYALVGLYVVDEVVSVPDVPRNRWHENAHTRKTDHWKHDIVVRAQRGCSGRLERCLSIGHYRDRAYRVRPNILDAWGGLSVEDGYIQRSAVPPSFLDAGRFYRWFQDQNVPLLERNN
jgi:hypothetical protein